MTRLSLTLLATLLAGAAHAECASIIDFGGENSVVVSEVVAGDATCTFSFDASAGQKLTVTTDSDVPMVASLMEPENVDLTAGSYTFTADGPASFVIGMTRNDARKHPEAVPFSAEVTLTQLSEAAAGLAADMAMAVGDWEGMLPCADCEGIEVYLNIMSDGTYTRTQSYKGSTTVAQDMGKWELLSGNLIKLTSEDKDEADTFLTFVEPGVVELADEKGQPTGGEMAAQYRLKKSN